MRILIAFVAIAGFCSATGQIARAEEPQDAPAKETAEEHAQKAQANPAAETPPAAHAEPQATTAEHAAQNSNYRFHNGRWWYWWPQTKSWKIWNGNAWIDYHPAQSQPAVTAQTRTFSYGEDDAAQTFSNTYAPVYRQNFAGFPDSVSNRQILGSYGFRSAGSKADGRY